LVNDKIKTEPSQIWEELSEEQRAHVRGLIAYIARQYVLALQEHRPENSKESPIGENISSSGGKFYIPQD
jgi:hypothetical protein